MAIQFTTATGKIEVVMTDAEKQAQVAAQCRAVVHLATALAEVHRQKAIILETGQPYKPVEFVGQQTASLMETLGDILNGMDAVDEDEDKWLDPIFAEAHRLWPSAA